MSKYIIGVDGGGTKTLGVLYNLKGDELKRSLSGFSNFNIDMAQAKSHLYEVLDDLTSELTSDDDVFVQLGISGYSKILDRQSFEAELGKKYHATVSLDSDVAIAFYDVKQTKEVNIIIVISGTGSVVMYSNHEQLNQIGGFGHLLGDEGSAYHLSISCLKAVIDYYEEHGVYDAFGLKLLKYLEVKDHFGIRDFVYSNEKTKIAGLATFISNLARSGDEKAKAFIMDEAKHLARQTVKAYLKIQDKEQLIIALRGGFLHKAAFLKTCYLNEIKMSIKDFKVDENDESPVKGAYYLSLLKLKKG